MLSSNTRRRIAQQAGEFAARQQEAVQLAASIVERRVRIDHEHALVAGLLRSLARTVRELREADERLHEFRRASEALERDAAAAGIELHALPAARVPAESGSARPFGRALEALRELAEGWDRDTAQGADR